MISINKYGQTLDLSNVVEANGKKTFSLDGLVIDKPVVISVPAGTRFTTSVVEDDLNIEFKDADGNIFELVLKNMASLLAQNDGNQLVEIVQSTDNKVLASITDIATALEAAAAGPEQAPAAAADGTSDSQRNNSITNDGLDLQNTTYDNQRVVDNNLQIDPVVAALNNVNIAPFIGAIAEQNIDEDNNLLITFTSSDANADTLTSNATALNGVVSITGNIITYTPNANFNGNDTITLTVSDGTATTIQTIAVTVNPVNDAPTIEVNSTLTVDEDGNTTITFATNDIDGDTLTSNATALNGVVSITGNIITYTPNANFNGNDTITLTINDGTIDVVQTIAVTVNPVNDAPTIEIQENSLFENTILQGQLTASDIDTNLTNLIYSTTAIIEGFVLNTDGSYSFDSNSYDYLAAGQVLNLSIPITVTDDFNATANSVLNIALTGTNDRPIIENIIVNEDNSLQVGTELSDINELSNEEHNVGYAYFTITETTVLRITTDGPTIDPVLYLFRNEGILDSSDFIASNDDGWTAAGSFNNSLINITLEPGNYIAAVSDFGFSMEEAISGINISDRVGTVAINFLADKNITLYNSNTITSLYIENSGMGNNVVTGIISTVSDLDTTDIHTYELVENTVLVNGENARDLVVSIYLNEITGKWEYKIDGNFNYLSEGDKAIVTFSYVANDGKGFDGTDTNNESSISEAKTITLTITGSNDAPTVTATPELVLSETDFGKLSVYENSYKIITEIEMYGLMGVEDVDVNDNLTLSLVSESSNFTSLNTGVLNSNSGVIQLTQDDIDYFGLINVNVGDFFIYSIGFNGLGDAEVATATFVVNVSDGIATTSSTINLTINGVNDAPTASVSSSIVSNDNVSYVGQLVANDVDINDTLTYTYDKNSVTMTLSLTGLNNLDSLLALNNPIVIQALNEIKTVGLTFVNTGNILALTTLSSSTIVAAKVVVSTLQDFLDSNSGLKNDILALKDFISANKASIIANTSLIAEDIVLLETLLTPANITALGNLFNTLEMFVTNPVAQAIVQNILADNVIAPSELALLAPIAPQIQLLRSEIGILLAANPTVIGLLDIPTIISKLDEVVDIDTLKGEITATVDVPSSIANLMIDLDANTGEYTVTNPYLSSLPDNTQVEVNFNYTVEDSAGAMDSSTAAMLITTANVNEMNVSINDGVLMIGEDHNIDMASLLSNATSNLNASDIDSIDLSNSEHILSNITKADFEAMVSDDSSNTLAITGENDDIVKLDLSIWTRNESDTDINSVVDNADDHFISYTTVGSHNQVLTLLIDKDITVENI